MKGIVLYPQFLQNFRCIGGECEDTCCAGWRIDLDKATFKGYKKLKSSMAIQQNIKRNKESSNDLMYGYIKMNECGSCPFLTEERLCGIQLNYGEDYLSNTCKTYPRSYRLVNNVVEKSATLSCPEVARLALLDSRPMEFEQTIEEIDSSLHYYGSIEINEENKTSKQDYFWDLRMFSIELIQNRDFTIIERLTLLGMCFQKVQDVVDQNRLTLIPSILESQRASWKNKKTLKASISSIPHKPELLVTICRLLIDSRLKTSGTGGKYFNLLEQTINGLNLNGEQVNTDDVLQKYQEGNEKLFLPFMREHEYIFENYIVYYIYSNLFPLQYDNIFENYVMLVLHFALLKVHLIGLANNQQSLTLEDTYHMIQSLTKEIDHNQSYIQRVKEFLKINKMDNMAYMSLLIIS